MTWMPCPHCREMRREDGYDAPDRLGDHYPPCRHCGAPAFVDVTTPDLLALHEYLRERGAVEVVLTPLELEGLNRWAVVGRERERRCWPDPDPVPADEPMSRPPPTSMTDMLFGLPIRVRDRPSLADPPVTC